MQWLYNMSTKGKILSLTVFMLALMSIVAAVGIKSSSDINDAADRLYEHEALGISYMKEANISLIYVARSMRNIMLAQSDERIDQGVHKQKLKENITRTEEYIGKAEKLFYTAAGKAKLQDLKQAFTEFKQMQETLLTLANQEEAAGIQDLKRDSVYKLMVEARPIGDKVDNLMTELSEIKMNNARQASIDTTIMYHDSRNMMLLVIGLAVLFGLLLGYLVGNRMGRNANMMAEAMVRVGREQDFNIRVNIEDKDELGQAGQALNSLLVKLQGAIADSNTIVSAIANGDFSQRVHNDYAGDLNKLKQGINGSADNIALVMKQLSSAMNAMSAGRFTVQLDTNAAGDYGVMLKYVSSTMNLLNAVISDINTVMSHMNAGDFNARVNASAVGDLLTMKDNINTSMSAIAQAINAISEVVAAQAMGDLTKELPSGAFKGQLHDLKNAINYSSAKVREVVAQTVVSSNIVSEAANQVSQGSSDLSGRVQEQAAALEQTSATMNEMAAAVQANTANARKVADLTRQVKNQSTDGVAVMQQTIDAMLECQPFFVQGI